MLLFSQFVFISLSDDAKSSPNITAVNMEKAQHTDFNKDGL